MIIRRSSIHASWTQGLPFDGAGSVPSARPDSPPSKKAVLLVVKRSGVTEPFSREKVITGVRRACQGRNVSDDALKRLAQEVEEAVRRDHGSHIKANAIGLAILNPLRELDEVAYLRFASVYKSFESAADFEKEIRLLHRLDRR